MKRNILDEDLQAKVMNVVHVQRQKIIEATMEGIRRNGNANFRNRIGETILHLLARSPDENTQNYLHELVNEYGADINIEDDMAKTPLLHCKELDTAIKIIQLGAKDRRGNEMLPILERENLSLSKIFTAYEIPNSYLIDPSEMKRKNKIGEGSYGNVFLCLWKEQDVAVKEMGQNIPLEKFIHEAKIMYELTAANTANIVRFSGFSVGLFTYKIVMEYASHGTLANYMWECKDTPWETRSRFMQATISGLKSIHDYKIIHCDFKLSNILINQDLQIKIADFGNSLYEGEDNDEVLTTITNRPPEIHELNTLYSLKSDIFSLAIVLWEIAEWNDIIDYQFNDMVAEDVREYYLSGQRPTFTSETPYKVSSLIKRCWETNQGNRPTSAEVDREVSEANFFCRNTMG